MEEKEDKTIHDKLTERERGLILQQPPEFFECKTIPVHDVDVYISIPAKGQALAKVFEAEGLLSQAGVTFDTGYGGGCRDWSFGLGLRGAYVTKHKDLSENEQKANVVYRILDPAKAKKELSCRVLTDRLNDVYVIVFGKKKEFGLLLTERLLNAGATEFYATPTQEEGEPEPPRGSFIGFKLRDTLIKVSFTENEMGY